LYSQTSTPSSIVRQFSESLTLVIHSLSFDTTLASAFAAILTLHVVDAVASNIGAEPLGVVGAVFGVLNGHFDSVEN